MRTSTFVGWIRLLGSALLVLGASGCALEDLPERTSETGLGLCTDGLDNDLDGVVDCQDEGCTCNRCGAFVEALPTRDVFGQVCARDCECDEGWICNLDASVGSRAEGRCLRDVAPGENELDVRFVVEVQDGLSTGRQNVRGRVRFDNQEHLLDALDWDARTPQFDFRGPDDASVLVQTFPPMSPSVGRAEIYRVDDDVLERAQLAEREVFRAFFAFYPRSTPPQGLPLTAQAVIETSTLIFEALTPEQPEIWSGRFRGRLRPLTALDRGRGNPCGRSASFDPTSSTCEPVDELRIFFGCPVGQVGEPPRGRVAFAVPEADEGFIIRRSPVGGEGDCGVAREPEALRLRGRTAYWVFEVLVPSLQIGPNVGALGLDGRLWFLGAGDGERPLFELVETPSVRRFTESLLWLDVFSEGESGRVFGWLTGRLEPPPP